MVVSMDLSASLVNTAGDDNSQLKFMRGGYGLYLLILYGFGIFYECVGID